MSKLAANIHRGIIALALSFSFMFFVYAPLEVFLGNTNEFWFDITHLAPIVLICFLISSAVIILFLELLYKFLYPKSKNAKRAFYIIYMIMLMIFIGLYIQGNYIPRDYGVLDGSTIDWSSYTSYAIASIVLWTVILLVGIILWIKSRKQILKIGQAASAIIFVMLITALISLFVNAESIVSKNNYVVTDKGQWSLSDSKNIYVLVLDKFDAEYLRVLLNEESEYSELLNDFTFYSNAIGGYPTTKASIPLMLTGEWYENDIPFEDYVSNAYEYETELYKELKEKNYSIGVYTGGSYLSKEDGLYENVQLGKYEVKDEIDFAAILYKLIAFEYFPHQLKYIFKVNTNDFESEKSWKNSDTADNKAYTISAAYWYETICEEGFKVESENDCFRFVHLYGMHPPYLFGEKVLEDGKEYSYSDALAGNMNIIKSLIDDLKEKGIYDNTAIMILADHGSEEVSKMGCSPLLLVKGFNEKHKFIISETPISWADIEPTLISWVTEQEQENAVWNIPNEERKRRFLYYSWDEFSEGEYMPIMTEYSISGNIAKEEAVFMKTGKQYIPVTFGQKTPININEHASIDFSEDGNFRDMVAIGWNGQEKNGVWSTDNSIIRFLSDNDTDLVMKISYGALVSDIPTVVKVNGYELCTLSQENAGQIVIPKEYLNPSLQELEFLTEGAMTPAEAGINGDTRTLGIYVQSITITDSIEQ